MEIWQIIGIALAVMFVIILIKKLTVGGVNDDCLAKSKNQCDADDKCKYNNSARSCQVDCSNYKNQGTCNGVQMCKWNSNFKKCNYGY
jgi:hypothetical protein